MYQTTVKLNFRSLASQAELNEIAFDFWTSGSYATSSPFIVKWSKVIQGNVHVLKVSERIPLLLGLVHATVHINAAYEKPSTFEGDMVLTPTTSVTAFRSFQARFSINDRDNGDFEMVQELHFTPVFFGTKTLTISGFRKAHELYLQQLKELLENSKKRY